MDSQATKRRDGVASVRSLVGICLGMMLIPVVVVGAPPQWWGDLHVSNGNIANDYAPVNQGQVKKLVKETVSELDAYLPGGAGDALHSIVAGWYIPNSQTNDYAPVNIGQLKALAKPVYDRLIALGYSEQYPWANSTQLPNDYAMANIGQAKNLFNLNFAALAAPTGLTATASNPGEMDLNWTNNANNATSITINESTDGGVTWNKVVVLTNPSLDSYAVTGLTQGVNYEFSVTANNSSGASSAATTGNSGTPNQSVPSTPTSFTGTLDSSGNMNLTWTASQGVVEYYKVEREDLSTGTWSPLTTLSATNYSDSSRQRGNGYHYRVSAINALGSSDTSNEFPLSRYAVIDMGQISPVAINNNNDVVGTDIATKTNVVFWHADSLTNVALPTIPDRYPSDSILTYNSTRIGGLNDAGTFVGYVNYEFDDPANNYHPDFEDQAVVWQNTQSDPTLTPSFTPHVLATTWDLVDGILGPSSSGNFVAGEYFPGGDHYWMSVDAPAFVMGFDPVIDQTYNVDWWGGPFDNSTGFASQNFSQGECMNRLGDVVGTSSQEATVTLSNGWAMFSNLVSNHVLWHYGSSNGTDFTPVILTFSWSVTSFTDSTNPTYVGTEFNSGHVFDGHIYDPSQTTADIDIGPYEPVSISTPTDPNQMQVIANGRQTIVNGVITPSIGYPFLFEKQTVPPATQASWMTTPLSINDLIGSLTGYQINSVSSLNNDGAMVGFAKKTSDSTSHGVMLLPMQLQSKDRMITGSVKLPDSWTGISLHFINETTGQDLGTFANVVENMTAATPAFKIYNTQEDIFSDSEVGQDQAGSLDSSVTQQKVVFYKDDNDPKLLHFATTFDDVGDVRVEIIKNGSVMGYNGIHLTADTDFSSLISEVDNRITNPYPSPSVDPTDPNVSGGSGDGLGLLVAQEPGSLSNPGAIDPSKSDPTQLVLPLHTGTALPSASDHDLSLVTLRRPNGLTSNVGTVTLRVSAPSSVALFNQAATHVLANCSVDLANPSGDLAALATGNAQIWLRGMSATTGVTFTYTYTDANGVVQGTDTVQMSVSTSGAKIWPGAMRDTPMFCGCGIRSPPGMAMSLMSMKVWSSVGQTAPIPPTKINDRAMTTKALMGVLNLVLKSTTGYSIPYLRGVLEGFAGGGWADLKTLALASTPAQIYYFKDNFARSYHMWEMLGELIGYGEAAYGNSAVRHILINNLLISAGTQLGSAYVQWESIPSDEQSDDIDYCEGYISGYVLEQVVFLKGLSLAPKALNTTLKAYEAAAAATDVPSAVRASVSVFANAIRKIPPADVPAAEQAIEEAVATPNGSSTEGAIIDANANSLNASSGPPFIQEFTQALDTEAKLRESLGYSNPWALFVKESVEHLGDLISDLGANAGHWAFQGYEKFCPSLYDFIGNDYFPKLRQVFSDSGTLNKADLQAFLEQLSDGPNNFLTRSNSLSTVWTSPQLVYRSGSAEGHRLIHLFTHTVPGYKAPPHSVFSVPRNQLLQLIDEAWSGPKVQALKPDGTPDPGFFTVNMGRVIGTSGETTIKIGVQPGTSNLITAYPYTP